MRRSALVAGSVCLVVASVLAGCSRSKGGQTASPPPPAKAEAAPGSTDVLKTQIEEIMAQGKRGPTDAIRDALAEYALPDPDAWFTRVYGAELGADLAASYPTDPKAVGERLAKALYLEHCHERGYEVDAQVYRPPTSSLTWPHAGVFAKPMVDPTDLYAVSISLGPDRESALGGLHVTWFVYDQGGYYFIGRPNVDPGAWRGSSKSELKHNYW